MEYRTQPLNLNYYKELIIFKSTFFKIFFFPFRKHFFRILHKRNKLISYLEARTVFLENISLSFLYTI